MLRLKRNSCFSSRSGPPLPTRLSPHESMSLQTSRVLTVAKTSPSRARGIVLSHGPGQRTLGPVSMACAGRCSADVSPGCFSGLHTRTTSSWRRCSGSATRSIATILPRLTVKPKTARGRPRGAHTSPGEPFTRAGCASKGRVVKISATAAAPRVSLEAPARTAALSARSTASGSSTASSAPKSPPREAARKASTTARSRVTSGLGADDPRTRRRARLASCRAAVGERSTMGAISSNGRSNMSWSTNATRSAGVSVSSTTRRARPTESAISASSAGSIPPARPASESGTKTPNGSSRRDIRDRSISRHTRATTVVSHRPKFWMALVSARLRSSQTSWTASSASLNEPSIR